MEIHDAGSEDEDEDEDEDDEEEDSGEETPIKVMLLFVESFNGNILL